MDKKYKIGIIYNDDSNWIGGTYYIENLISSFQWLPQEKQPEIIVLSRSKSEYEKLKNVTENHDLKHFSTDWHPSLFKRGVNKLTRSVLSRHIFSTRLDNIINVAFPNPLGIIYYEVKKKVFWLPDFQHYRLPHLFSKEEKTIRNRWFELPTKGNYPVVLSSQAAKDDYFDIFPDAKNQVYVLPFAVKMPDLGGETSIKKTLEKYEITKPYFLCSNQFWVHKNHMLVLKAVKKLVGTFSNIQILFTGKEYDPRDPAYTDTLKKYVVKHKLEKNISFLGFIDRGDQLRLMIRALAVIQPSLFEGWSTVIEDAKCLGQNILASSLPVNKEQLENYPKFHKAFFDPYDESELAELLTSYQDRDEVVNEYDYRSDIRRFAENFISIVDSVMR